MVKLRIFAFVSLLACGGALIAVLLARGIQTPLGRTFAPVFGLVGQSTKTLDRLLSGVLPLEDIDERTLGEAIEASVSTEGDWQVATAEAVYVNELLKELSQYKERPFDYRGYVIEGPPNACAFPGGIILVSSGLFEILSTEAQLVSVLGHEMGHVEQGHCFDAARFEMLSRKLAGSTLGQIADCVYSAMLGGSFSQAQETEADEYAFAMLIACSYDPNGMSEAFAALEAWKGTHPSVLDPLRDYLESHPPVEVRRENFLERAQRWRLSHLVTPVYVGERNYRERAARSRVAHVEEWSP